MRLFFRTRAEKRRTRRRATAVFYTVMLSLTVLFAASMGIASLVGWLSRSR